MFEEGVPNANFSFDLREEGGRPAEGCFIGYLLCG